MNVCKDCINNYLSIDDQTNFMSDEFIKKFQKILLELNKPFVFDWYTKIISEIHSTSARATRASFFGTYNKKMILIENKKNHPLTWLDSVFSTDEDTENNKINTTVTEKEDKYVTAENRKQLEHFWGKGLTDESYEWLDTEYSDYDSRYDIDSKTLENTIKELCLTQWDIRQARAKGTSVDRLEKTFQDLMGTANLKPVQETGANATEQETFSTLIKKYENEKPIPKPSPEWEDVDGIRKKITIWFTGHLSKMLGLKNNLTVKYDDAMKQYTVDRSDRNSQDDNDEI